MTDASPAKGPLIVIADDHPIMRTALRGALQGAAPGVRFVEAGDAQSALALIDEFPDIDLLLMDLNMPGTRGLDAVRAVRERAPQLPVAVISAEHPPGTVDALLALGVAGFIPKSDRPEVIASAVQLVLAGGVYAPPSLLNGQTQASAASANGLTSRQREVLRLLAQGKSNKLIARELGVTEGTVKAHLLTVFRVLDVRNRTAAVLAAQRFID